MTLFWKEVFFQKEKLDEVLKPKNMNPEHLLLFAALLHLGAGVLQREIIHPGKLFDRFREAYLFVKETKH